MPNDVPDWTAQTKANLVGGISNLNLGDVGAPSLQADSVTESFSGAGGLAGNGSIVLASFKAAAASTIAKVGALGALLVGTASSVSPLFGQAPTAGNLLVAWVTAGSGDPTTNAAGWVKGVSLGSDGQFSAIWYKPNAAGGDAAPVFTVGAGSNLMSAQLGEFSGAATVSPLDQSGSSAYTTNPIAVVGGAIDVAFGDLVLTASRVEEQQSGTAVFTNTINNGGTPVQAGSAQVGSGGNRGCNFTYTIIPAATVAQPLGVAAWAYDSVGNSRPATGSIAQVILAATPGKTYTLAELDVALVQVSGALTVPGQRVIDGGIGKWNRWMGVTATAGDKDHVYLSGLGLKGTAGNSMTIDFDGNNAGVAQAVNVGAYLR